jgi:Methyltransferase domain
MDRKFQNLSLLLRLLLRNPVEFWDRTNLLLQGRREKLSLTKQNDCLYPERLTFHFALENLSQMLGLDLNAFLGEPEFYGVRAYASELTAALDARDSLPFPTIFNADSTLACLAYVLCRALRPKIVVETGVAYGVTSAMILAALHKNGFGVLHSVDLPPLREEESCPHIGLMVPQNYRSSWRLHLGVSKRLLPKLLSHDLGEIGLFVHDSSNLNGIQKLEQELVWPYLAPNSAILVNNIGHKSAFAEFVRDKGMKSWLSVEQREKQGDLTGVFLRRACLN